MDERRVDHSGPDEEAPGKHETDLNIPQAIYRANLLSLI